MIGQDFGLLGWEFPCLDQFQVFVCFVQYGFCHPREEGSFWLFVTYLGKNDIRCAHKARPLGERSATLQVRGRRGGLEQR